MLRKRDYKRCFLQIKKIQKKLPVFINLLNVKKLFCELKRSKRTGRTKKLENFLKYIESQPKIFFKGPHFLELARHYLDSYLFLFKKYRKKNIKKAWFLTQKLLSHPFMIIEKKVGDVYSRIAGISKAYGKQDLSVYFLEKAIDGGAGSYSQAEYKRLTGRFYKPKKWRALQEQIAKKASRIHIRKKRFYFRLYQKRNKKPFNKAFKKLTQKGSAETLFYIADYFYSRHRYNPALLFAKACSRKIRLKKKFRKAKNLNIEKLHLILGSSNYHLGRYNEAEKYFKKLFKNYEDIKIGHEALFRLALLNIRKQRWKKSENYLKKLLEDNFYNKLNKKTGYRLLAYYWLWRVQQKLGRILSNLTAHKMIKEYPLTYYGLRARAELNKNKLLNFKKDSPQEFIKLSDKGFQSWIRYKILLQAGWLKEARSEIPFIFKPKSVDEKLFVAQLFALSLDYGQSIALSSKILQENPDKINWPRLFLNFPKEFTSEIKKQGRRRGLSPYLILGLIKQESSFHPRVISSSRAIGLMQLIPATARETARIIRYRNLKIPWSLYHPKVNILLGSSYLFRMVKAFNGHRLWALAAYNAGIGHIRRWKNLRPETATSENTTAHFDPFSELWVDELPWSETRFYIKAVARNYLIYKLQAQGDFKLTHPFWSN